ncbi:MAG: AAA family ATPase [Calothrix sp. MO_167.B12]|nr:AAA family ATPase [Calothrix sp. MO_167.B12]
MFKSIKIENFRCFQSFELQQLGRVNLLVGKNNSGKTSILEAIQILSSQNNLQPLADIMINRGEYIWDDNGRGKRELDIRHLFYGHEIEGDSKFYISGINNEIEENMLISIEKNPSFDRQNHSDEELQQKFHTSGHEIEKNKFFLRFNWTCKKSKKL